MSNFLVLAEVITALDEAASAVPAGHEIGGYLLVHDRPDRGNVIARFEQQENLETGPLMFRCVTFDPPAGYRAMFVHSHPDCWTLLTEADRDAALTDNPTGAYEALYAHGARRLSVFQILPSRSVVHVPVEVEGARRRRSVSRPRRRDLPN